MLLSFYVVIRSLTMFINALFIEYIFAMLTYCQYYRDCVQVGVPLSPSSKFQAQNWREFAFSLPAYQFVRLKFGPRL